MSLLSRLLSVGADRPLRRLETDVREVNRHAERFAACPDAVLVAEANRLRSISTAEEWPESPGSDLPVALALVREASRRIIGQYPFDVQMMGALALTRGWVAEMQTGEGKTLAAVPAVFAYALAGRGVHVVTANEYLAARDTEWMGDIYRFLGLRVGVTTSAMEPAEKRAAYRCDVTYGTAREFGFDYLRDNLVQRRDEGVQRGHWCAIVDEADFVLLDEARVPLVVTGPAEEAAAECHLAAASAVDRLRGGVDYQVDEEKRTVWLTASGARKVEEHLGVDLYAEGNEDMVAHVQLALRAAGVLWRDRDYVVLDDRVEIVDEFTGRVIPGRRWAEGLHQAVEAKEGVTVRLEAEPLAQITTRSYFGMYRCLAGMTGTAAGDAAEFADAYGMQVVAIPTNRPVIRVDHPDDVYATADAKYTAVAAEIAARHLRRQPVLVGTSSVRHSEYLSVLLDRQGIPHTVLNAKQDAAEAAIVAEAGRPGAVTVATNMAGRGVDILLGGNPGGLAADELMRRGIDLTSPEGQAELEQILSGLAAACRADGELVRSLGGLFVLGVGRQESRRVDDQLRGRAGRQGDPGESRFCVSLQDDLVVVFGPADDPAAPYVTAGDFGPLADPRAERIVVAAQAAVESRNRDLREHTRNFDEIIDHHYRAVCHARHRLLSGRDLGAWTLEKLEEHAEEIGLGAMDRCLRREHECGGPAVWPEVQRRVMLAVLDRAWSDYLVDRRDIRRWINFVAFGGRYPITEWRRHAEGGLAELWREVEVGFLKHLLFSRVCFCSPEPATDASAPSRLSFGKSRLAPESQPLSEDIRPPEEEAARARGDAHRAIWRRVGEGVLTADWLQGFAGPAFEEIVVTLDDVGAPPPDAVAIVDLDPTDPHATRIFLKCP